MLYLVALLTARRAERGASAVEYGLLVAGTLAACIFAFDFLSETVQAVFSQANTDICDGC